MSGTRNVLLFGATGNAGGAVLEACLSNPEVSEVRAIVRRPLARRDPRVRVIRHDDFTNYTTARDAFTGVDACFFCLGISVRQVGSEAEYRRITLDFAVAAATMLLEASPEASFEYLSGNGAHAGSRMMWARVKAEAELELRSGLRPMRGAPGSSTRPVTPRRRRFAGSAPRCASSRPHVACMSAARTSAARCCSPRPGGSDGRRSRTVTSGRWRRNRGAPTDAVGRWSAALGPQPTRRDGPSGPSTRALRHRRIVLQRLACGAVLPSVIPSAHLIASKYIVFTSGSAKLSGVWPKVE